MGYPEWIDTILAILTLFTLVFSIFTSLSAAKSAKAAVSQVRVMKEDSEFKLTSNLVPIDSYYKKESLLLNETMDALDNLDLEVGDITIKSINAGQGNAFYISSWVEIDNSYFEHEQIIQESPSYFEDSTGHVYKLLGHSLNDDGANKYIRFNSKDWRLAEDSKIYDYPIVSKINLTMLAQQKDSIETIFPAYVQILLLNYVYHLVDERETPADSFVPRMTLVFRYKSEKQLKTSGETTRKYEIKVDDAKLNEGQVTFKLIYVFIEEV